MAAPANTIFPARRALIVEDESSIREIVRLHLSLAGFETVEVADGKSALDRLRAHRFDLVVLDVMLPKVDGVTVCRALRSGGPNERAAVLMLTARDTELEKVLGLESGADDYLTKPFSFDELLARVRALLRRGQGQRAPVLRLADLTLDPSTREVRRGARRIILTAREYALLEYFLRSAGRVLSRPLLAEHVWGLDFDPESNIVDVYVGYLRRKIDGPGEPRLLHTIRGAGYVLRAEP